MKIDEILKLISKFVDLGERISEEIEKEENAKKRKNLQKLYREARKSRTKANLAKYRKRFFNI